MDTFESGVQLSATLTNRVGSKLRLPQTVQVAMGAISRKQGTIVADDARDRYWRWRGDLWFSSAGKVRNSA
jgi:hypothetical protein